MNWLVFTLLAYVTMAAQLGLGSLLVIETRYGMLQPRLELILLVAAATAGATRPAIGACVALGLAVDLATPHAGGAIVIGPYTLGFAAAAIVVLQLRTALMRGHPLSIVFCVIAGGLATGLVTAGIWSLRAAFYGPPPGFSGLGYLTDQLLSVGYTALIALPLAWPVRRLMPRLGTMGPAPGHGRR